MFDLTSSDYALFSSYAVNEYLGELDVSFFRNYITKVEHWYEKCSVIKPKQKKISFFFGHLHMVMFPLQMDIEENNHNIKHWKILPKTTSTDPSTFQLLKIGSKLPRLGQSSNIK